MKNIITKRKPACRLLREVKEVRRAQTQNRTMAKTLESIEDRLMRIETRLVRLATELGVDIK